MDGGRADGELGSLGWLLAAHGQLAACATPIEGQPLAVDEFIAGVLAVLVASFDGSRAFLLGPLAAPGNGPPAETQSWDLGVGGPLTQNCFRPSSATEEQIAKARLHTEPTTHDIGLLSGEGVGEVRLYRAGQGDEGWIVGLQWGGDAAELDTVSLQSFSSLAIRAIELVVARHTQHQLLALRSIDETIWERSKHGLVLIGEDGNCARANAVASRLLGLSEDELLQFPPVSWLPSPFSISGASTGDGTWQGLLASGTGLGVPVEIAQSQLFGADETMSLLQLIDRSDVVGLEEQLQKLQQHQLMGRLCGGVVHDLNNLLTVIVAALEKAERDLGDQVQPLILSDGQEAVRRCESLCSQLLTMGQCEPGPLQIIRPDAVIGNTERLLSRATPEHVEFSLTLGAPDAQALLPSGALELILLNLLIGASEGLPKGAGIRMSTRAVGGRFHLFLEDNGPGMGEGRLHRMFASPSKGQMGAATGLAVVHTLVSKIGGQVEIQSVPGRGTQFDVSLLTTSDEPKTPPPPHSDYDASIRGTGKTILLCENDPVLRDVVAGTLSKQGYGVVACADGRRGLAMIESGKTIDALVTDLVMPNVGGSEVAVACNTGPQSTPVVFVSGLLDRDALPEIGAPSEFLPKPFRMNDLLAALQAVLAKVSD